MASTKYIQVVKWTDCWLITDGIKVEHADQLKATKKLSIREEEPTIFTISQKQSVKSHVNY